MKNLLYLLGCIIIISSCQKVIDVDLNETDPKFVIEANYTAEDSTVSVKITFTSSYFDASAPTTVNNATVVITNHLGMSLPVTFIGNGMYELTNYVPIFETNYTLTVSYGGVTYTAVSTMHAPVQLEDITYEFYPGFFGLEPGYVCDLNFYDPAGVENFYVVALSLNGVADTKLTSLFIQNDLFSDGNLVSRPLFKDEFNQVGDTVGMELRSVDKATYQYYYEILSIAGGQTTAAPSNPANNWDNEALGYFSAYSNNRKEVVIEE